MSLFETLIAGAFSLPFVMVGLADGDAAQATATDALAVDDAVTRLAAPDRATRLAAERELIERGSNVLELLPASRDVDDVAVRTAIDRIRKRLELLRAEQTLQPGRLELRGVGSAGELAAEHVALTSEQSRRSIELSGETRTYWQVIDDVARQIDGWPDRVLPDKQMTFRDRTPSDEKKRITYVGPFRLAAGPVEAKPVAGDASRRLVRIPLELRTEPRLRPLFVGYAAKNLRLVDDEGDALPPFTPAAKYDLPFGDRDDATDLRLDFLATDGVAEPLTFSGSLLVTVAAAEERFAFPLDDVVRSPTETSHGGVTVRVRQASRTPNGNATVELAVVYDRGGPAFESHRTWVYHNIARLTYEVEREGRTVAERLDHEPGFSTIAQADGGVVLAFRFAGLPKDAQHVEFIYDAPTRIVEAPVEFVIDGLRIEP
ncbi:MAG: hypothetical protein WBC44_10790 [Planctomycetaceae bacterium]